MNIFGNIVDIYNRTTYYGYISIDGEYITSIVKLSDDIDDKSEYIAPGLVDSHVHIESSMLTPQQFAKMAVKYGNIASVCDPHEIANVLGKKGIEFMINDSLLSKYHFFFTMPSCVPATKYETNGCTLSLGEIIDLSDKSVGLAEVMDYVGVIDNDNTILDKIEYYKSIGKPIDGHVPSLSGEKLSKYISAGISTDHECSNIDEALEKINLSMMIQIREGSSAKNYESLKNLFTIDDGKYVDSLMLCMDDAHPDDIRERGYINRFLKSALRDGISIYDIYKAALINPVIHYNLDVGMMRLGDKADFVIFNNLSDFQVSKCYINAECVYDSSKDFLSDSSSEVDRVNNFAFRTFVDTQFGIVAEKADARVIEIFDGELLTREYIWSHSYKSGTQLFTSVDEDIMKIVVINRYSIDDPISIGLIKGTGLKFGAMASSIAHDSHNVVIIGRDDKSIALVANEIFRMKGGIVVTDGTDLKSLSLPIAGLMTDLNYNTVADNYQSLISFVHNRCFVQLKSPFMTMAFMSLLVIPTLKIGDKGLFDVTNNRFVNLFV